MENIANSNLVSSSPIACADVLNADLVTVFKQQPTPSKERISLRAQKLMEIILSEDCLPIGLRSVLAEEWGDLQKLLNSHVCGFHAIEWKVNAIVLTLGWCREVSSNSQLVSQMKLLDMEMTAYLDSLQANTMVRRNAG
ncbi:MAG: hypothetical protein ACI81V_000506 [Lentimonas sp.]|jgi:hypothetical protein